MFSLLRTCFYKFISANFFLIIKYFIFVNNDVLYLRC